MAYNRIQAGRLLSGKEMELFESSLADQASALNGKQLQSAIKRMRTQRSKYEDLLQRQRLSSRERSGSKSGTSGATNERTAQKAELFAQALQRLEKQQARREAAEAREAARAGKTSSKASGMSWPDGSERSSKAPAPRPRSGPAKGAAARQGPASLGHRKHMQEMGLSRSLGHVSARGRRQQARRDAR